MGLELLAYGALALGGVAAIEAHQSRQDAAWNAKQSAEEQKKAQAEQNALNAAQKAEEQRKQVREERVRKARIVQASVNTGVSASSGEMGAVGSVNTQSESNIGLNLGAAQAGQNISGYMQNAADFNTASQQASFDAQNWDSIGSISGSIFTGAGGFGALKGAPKAKT